MATLTTATNNFSKTVVDLISQQILDSLRAGLPHLPNEVAVLASHVKGTDGVFRFINYGDFPADTTSLTEGVAFPLANEQTLAIDYDEFTALQKGGVVRSSDLALIESPHDMVAQLIEKTKRHALLTIDEVARLVWDTPVSGENVIRPAGIASRVLTAAGSIITGLLVRAAAANLAARDVARVGSTPSADQGQIGGEYVGIAHPHVLFDLQADTATGGWTDAAKYAKPVQLMTGEVGMYMGVRFISSTRATIKANAGVGSVVDVYRTIITGKQAIAWADPTSLMTAFIPPTPTKDDPLGQIAKAGWKAFVGGVLTDAGAVGGRYVVIESSSSLGANT